MTPKVSVKSYKIFNTTKLADGQGCSGIGKKDPGSIFFFTAISAGLLTYLIRNPVTVGSKYGNVTSAVAPFFFFRDLRATSNYMY